MQISVKSDIAKLRKDVGVLFRSQIPFASQVAINATAFDVRRATQTALKSRLHKPTQYTFKSGLQVEKATSKKNPIAKVGFRSETFGKGSGSIPQADYMKRLIEGGTRLPRGKSIPVPVPKNMKPNKSGNIPRGKINRLLGDKDRYFSGVPNGGKGDAGIWERMPRNSKRAKSKNKGGKIRMVISYESKTQYQSIFPFKKIASTIVKRKFKRNFEDGMRFAIKRLAR
jgi:hypothetical protein